MNWFPEIKKNFGFGCMRLPMLENEQVDLEQCKEMIDLFLAAGFNYVDTAHGYIDGKSELAIRDFLTKRCPREAYLLTDKLTDSYFKCEEDIRPFFQSQLEACGVDYFDFYLLHAQNAQNYKKFRKCHAYETCFDLKREGKIRHVGLSFHDKAEVLDRILEENPQIEVVQIQYNYADYADATVESKKVYEVCVRHQKPVIVMEPVKGGRLIQLPEKAQKIFDALQKDSGKHLSNASYAIRFAADPDNMVMVLSGMSNMEQMRDNLSFMTDYRHLTEEEKKAIEEVRRVFLDQNLIPCTSCHYCVEENHCPKGILIPDLFSCLNGKRQFDSWNQDFYYQTVLTANGHGSASSCIKCGQCEKVCPQHLPIRDLLVDVAKEFESHKA